LTEEIGVGKSKGTIDLWRKFEKKLYKTYMSKRAMKLSIGEYEATIQYLADNNKV